MFFTIKDLKSLLAIKLGVPPDKIKIDCHLGVVYIVLDTKDITSQGVIEFLHRNAPVGIPWVVTTDLHTY